MSPLHADALTALRSWNSDDPAQEALRAAFVRHLEDHPDGTDRACGAGHLTAGVVILSADLERVLLTLHTKARRWFHMGGHCEPADVTLAGAALREGEEESGVTGLVLDPTLVHLDRHTVPFCGDHAAVDHLDVRFVAVAPDQASHSVSDESLDVRWWPVGRLPDTPDLALLVAAARRRAAGHTSVDVGGGHPLGTLR